MSYLPSGNVDLHYALVNPLQGTISKGVLGPKTRLITGQPIVIYSTDEELVNTLAFSFYEGEGSERNRAREVQWSTGYTDRNTALYVLKALESFRFLRLDLVKHPDRDEWAIPYNRQIFETLTDGPIKVQISKAAIASQKAGLRLTKEQMLDQGWA